jgi:hypothetical protein
MLPCLDRRGMGTAKERDRVRLDAEYGNQDPGQNDRTAD